MVGVCLLVVGLVVGLVPVSSGGVSCGSAFVGSNEAYVRDLTSTLDSDGVSTNLAGDCGSLRSVLRIPAVALLALGVLALGGAALTGTDGRRP